ncbi:MAG: M1 family metallopeptidase [Bacteroidales bacterium]|nr:M1 family metallopeptidase [Bacteroidales bacterium]
MNRKLKYTILFFLMLCFCKLFPQKYFQQEVNYTISVKLNDVSHELSGFEKIQYINNSPNTLEYIYFHLWPNAYNGKTTALYKQLLKGGNFKLYEAKQEQLGYIDSIDFKVNGEKIKWKYDSLNVDICKLVLDKPLKSGDTIVISTPFHVKIPDGKFSRFGHVGQSYQITQWFPKPAVYDANGWTQMPYLSQGEFYSEFGSFDVAITLPENYVVGATGDLQNEDEIKWLTGKAEETQKFIYFNRANVQFPQSSKKTKTLRYVQKNIHDFAWFADKRYNVLKGEIKLPHSGKSVTSWAMFTNAEGNLWRNSIGYINDAIYYYSLWVGDYPYNNVTAVDGTISAGTGMEYPNITVIGTSGTPFILREVIVHEVGHNWFYGMLGSNERKNPWMDEGINSFYTSRYIESTVGGKLTDMLGLPDNISRVTDLYKYKVSKFDEIMYLFTALTNNDQPLNLPSECYTSINYGADIYFKGTIVMRYLMTYMGKENFDKAMQKYFEEWKYKHPSPEDFKKIITGNTDKNLDWFFNDLLGTTKKIDYKISSVKIKNDTAEVKIKNKGKIASPFSITKYTSGGTVETQYYEGFYGKKKFDFENSGFSKIKIDANEIIPDINRKNNSIKTRGIFRKSEPLKFNFIGSIDNSDRKQIFYFPGIGVNNYDKLMVGVAFYNHLLFQKKIEYTLVPMYSSGTNELSGWGNVNYNLFPDKIFQNVKLGLSFLKYTYSYEPFLKYYKVYPELLFVFKKRIPTSSYVHSLKLRNINITKDVMVWNGDKNEMVKKQQEPMFNEVIYSFENGNSLYPYSINLKTQQNTDFVKSSLEFKYRLTYNKKKKGLDLRFFTGAFLWQDTSNHVDYRFRMNGQAGYEDYTFDNYYLGRSDYSGLASQQFTETDGAFKVNTPIGQTNDWLVALNIKTSIPGILPLKLYADFGTYSRAGRVFEGSKKIIYDAGVDLALIPNMLEIYFPVFWSSDIETQMQTNSSKYSEKIRFTLYLNSMNLFDSLKNIKLM